LIGQFGYSGTSPDGVTWTSQTPPSVVVAAWNGSIFCALDSFGFTSYTSADGVTWVSHSISLFFGVQSMTWTGRFFCAVSQFGSSAATSVDGVVWVATSLPFSSGWGAIG
jgi:hypothetical protein